MRKTKLQAVPQDQDLSEESYENDQDADLNDEEIKTEKERTVKESKYNNLLTFLKDYQNDYEIWLYKKGERNKRFCMAKYDNYLPDPFTDILPKYGGGEYILMLRVENKMMDTAIINLLDPAVSPTTISTAPGAGSRADLLNELKLMAEIFKGNQAAPAAAGADLSKILLEITKIQIEQARIMSENQQKSEQRMTQLILEMQSKKPALSEIMDVVQFVDDLKHGGAVTGEGDSIVEKLINSPVVAPIIQGLLSKAIAPATNPPPVPAPIPATVQVQAPAPATSAAPIPATVKLTASDFFIKIPDDFKVKVNQENRDEIARFIYNNNPDLLDFQTAAEIVDLILKEKALLFKDTEQK